MGLRVRRLLNLGVSIAKNRVGAVPRPSWCTYLVSYRCNARCGMCDLELPRFCGQGQLTRRRSSHVHGIEGAEGEKRGGRARARLSVHGGVSTRSAEDGRRRKVCDDGQRRARGVDGDAQTMAFAGGRRSGTRWRIRVFGRIGDGGERPSKARIEALRMEFEIAKKAVAFFARHGA